MRIKHLCVHMHEHLSVNPPVGFTWISPQLSDLLRHQGELLHAPLEMTYGSHQVRKHAHTVSKSWYGVFNSASRMLLFAEVSEIANPDSVMTGYHQLTKLERDSDQITQDMPMAFMHYLVQDLSYKLISDDVMSNKGDQFWQKIQHRGQLSVMILDIQTGIKYTTQDVLAGTWSEKDQARIQMPHADRRMDQLRTGSTVMRSNYRFYYVTEGLGSHVMEHLIHMRPDHARLIRFGEQNYADYQG
jgi:hypothetical protein